MICILIVGGVYVVKRSGVSLSSKCRDAVLTDQFHHSEAVAEVMEEMDMLLSDI